MDALLKDQEPEAAEAEPEKGEEIETVETQEGLNGHEEDDLCA